MRFAKWHAHGNAYLVVQQPDAGTLTAERVGRLCDAATGIGSDGVVELVRVEAGEAEVVIWNPDGSVAEMSGNGVRIAACHLVGQAEGEEISILTGGRSVHTRLLGGGEAEMDMGAVEVGPPERVGVDGADVELTVCSVGNPHAVMRLDGATRDDLLRLGPALERNGRFPQRTNVQLVEPVGVNELRVLVWERGAGETASSGSSATAAAAVAVARDWVLSPVTVHLPGGDLTVTMRGTHATLLGPAERICAGDTLL